jgi:hypothetical protein
LLEQLTLALDSYAADSEIIIEEEEKPKGKGKGKGKAKAKVKPEEVVIKELQVCRPCIVQYQPCLLSPSYFAAVCVLGIPESPPCHSLPYSGTSHERVQ